MPPNLSVPPVPVLLTDHLSILRGSNNTSTGLHKYDETIGTIGLCVIAFPFLALTMWKAVYIAYRSAVYCWPGLRVRGSAVQGDDGDGVDTRVMVRRSSMGFEGRCEFLPVLAGHEAEGLRRGRGEVLYESQTTLEGSVGSGSKSVNLPSVGTVDVEGGGLERFLVFDGRWFRDAEGEVWVPLRS